MQAARIPKVPSILVVAGAQVCKQIVPAAKRAGYQCVCCEDKVSALKTLAEKHFEVAIVDDAVHSDGMFFVQRARDRRPLTECILLSATMDHSRIRDVQAAGVRYCLSKPLNNFELETLLKALSSLKEFYSLAASGP